MAAGHEIAACAFNFWNTRPATTRRRSASNCSQLRQRRTAPIAFFPDVRRTAALLGRRLQTRRGGDDVAASVTKSSGDAELDQAALRAVKTLWNLLNQDAGISDLVVRFSEAATGSRGGLRELVQHDAFFTIIKIALERPSPTQESQPLERPDGRFIILKRKKA